MPNERNQTRAFLRRALAAALRSVLSASDRAHAAPRNCICDRIAHLGFRHATRTGWRVLTVVTIRCPVLRMRGWSANFEYESPGWNQVNTPFTAQLDA